MANVLELENKSMGVHRSEAKSAVQGNLAATSMV